MDFIVFPLNIQSGDLTLKIEKLTFVDGELKTIISHLTLLHHNKCKSANKQKIAYHGNN